MNRLQALELRFWNELEKSNAIKTKNSRAAVVIKAKYDENGMFTAAPAQSLLLQIAKTHRVVIKSIEDASQLGSAMREAYSELGAKFSLLMIMAHGHPNQMQFGRGKSWFQFFSKPFYRKEHIVKKDFKPLSPDGKIFLYSCSTGQGIAQDIANISKRTVLAPSEVLWDIKTCLQNSTEGEFEVVSYNEKNQQHIKIFSPKTLPYLVSQSDLYSGENERSFSDMSEYLKRAASKGDASSQWKLGICYLLGMGSCEKSEKKAAYWLVLAAKKGVAQAQFELGNMYLSGLGGLEKSEAKAGKWFSLSAKQQFPQALFQMGVFYLNGQCGFIQSDERTAEFFTKAAKKGIPQALFNLGVLYEYGRGVRRSLNYAKYLYEIAEGLGMPEAKNRSIPK